MRAIDRLFTPDVLARLATIKRPTQSPFDKAGAVWRNRHVYLGATDDAEPGVRAMRRTWASYLDAAESCGLLDHADVVSALTGSDDDAYRAAIAEALVAFVLSSALGVNVQTRPESKSGKNVDFRICSGDSQIDVEVKAPFVPRTSNHWSGNDTRAVLACIKDAGSQFKKNRQNILVVVPTFRTPVYSSRRQLVEAVLGQRAVAVFVSLDDTDPPPPEPSFIQNGKLARLRPASDGQVTTDFTRVSAVMSIEERYKNVGDDHVEVGHAALVVHNPFAANPINPSLFGDIPQFVKDEECMRWTDNYCGA